MIGKLLCKLGLNHTWVLDRAEDLERGAATIHRKGQSPVNADGCTVVKVCETCGAEQRMAANINFAIRYRIPLEWNDGDTITPGPEPSE